MSTSQPKLAPVEGRIIAQSRLKTLCVLAFLVAALLLGIALVWSWWTKQPLPLLRNAEGGRWNGAIGALLIAMSGILLQMGVAYLLFAQERLIIGKDRLQILLGGEVDAQIPFRNIRRIGIAKEEGVSFLGIVLIDLTDPDTRFQASGPEERWHFCILDVYEHNLDEIHRLLTQSLNEFSNPATSA